MNDDIESILMDDELKKRLKSLVLERVQVMPDTLGIVIGGTDIPKKELLHHIEDEDEIGKQMMEMELEFLRDLASGAVYRYE